MSSATSINLNIVYVPLTASGGYDVVNLAETKESKPGDLNLDSNVNVFDAILLARVLAEHTTVSVTEKGMQNADMNGSGTPDSVDLTLILKQIADIKD